MIKFEKVSLGQFCFDFQQLLSQDELLELTEKESKDIYENLKLPARATKGSAGYDFYAPVCFELAPGETIKIPTGMRALMPSDVVLQIYPRSGLGCKYRLQFDNTIPVIDSDYSDSDNQGHILLSITNDSNKGKKLSVKAGQAIAQGIFLHYLKTDDDTVKVKRNGGFGSTDKLSDKVNELTYMGSTKPYTIHLNGLQPQITNVTTCVTGTLSNSINSL